MASMSSGPLAVKGAEVKIAEYRTDRRVGRIDFRIRSIDGQDVEIQAEEEDLDGNVTLLGDPTEIVAGGDQTLTVVSNKPIVRIRSSDSNTGTAYVRLDAQYIGLPFTGGQMDVGPNLPRDAFDGPNLSGSGKL